MTSAPDPAPPAPRWVPRRWLRRPRRTVRLRLTLLYGGLFLLSGAGLLAITYALVSNRLPVIATSHGGTAVKPPGTAGGGTRVCFFLGQPGAAPPAAPPDCLAASQLAVQQRGAELNQLLIESGIALAIMTVVSIGLGWLVAGRVLRPLRTITAPARATSSRNSGTPLTGCWPGWRPRSGPSASSSPTPRTNCAPRWPGSGP